MRETNPGLHLLYVKTACKHLAMIDSMIKRVSACSNLNMDNLMFAIIDEREKLVTDDAAYADADEILQSLKHKR